MSLPRKPHLHIRANRQPHGMSEAAGQTGSAFRWLRSGEAALAAMLAAIGEARQSVRLETYMFKAGGIGDRFLQALLAASRRGVKVQVLADAFGSLGQSDSYWQPLRDAGGEFRWFNAPAWRGCRDHRKVLVVDGAAAFICGCNIAPEYFGDGVARGWRDLGMKSTSTVLAGELAEGFDAMFQRAEARPKRLHSLRRARYDTQRSEETWQLLLSGPGWGHRRLKQRVAADIARAHDIRIISAYFLPTWRLHREIVRAARRGRPVRLILAGQSDVKTAQLATRWLYPRLLRAGVEIYEYQPQVLHAKLLVLGEVVYAGSANLDTRSLNINYELLLRLEEPALAAEARSLFEHDLRRSRRIVAADWHAARSLLNRLLQAAAFLFLTKVDPYLTRRWLKQ